MILLVPAADVVPGRHGQSAASPDGSSGEFGSTVPRNTRALPCVWLHVNGARRDSNPDKEIILKSLNCSNGFLGSSVFAHLLNNS